MQLGESCVLDPDSFESVDLDLRLLKSPPSRKVERFHVLEVENARF